MEPTRAGDDSATWQAIDGLRNGQAEQGKQVAVLEAQFKELREDNRELRHALGDTEGKILKAVKAVADEFTGKFERQSLFLRWVVALSLPTITALATAYLGKS